jgi:tetratricopeptide (TPR) repeat protein
MLALLYGAAQARLGQHEEGTRWVELALARSREQQQNSLETRALNTRGAIAFVSGRVDEAADYLTQGLMAASRDGDHGTIGRCSNNLGIINNVRGRHAEAIGSYTIAIAAFRRAGLRNGVAECRHNLGITYTEQRDLDRALEQANRAVEEATAAGDQGLTALTLRGRAEVLVLLGQLRSARDEIERALGQHRELSDGAEEAEDLRVLAMLQAAEGDLQQAERTLCDVIDRAETNNRPQLVGEATRDLAYRMQQMGRRKEARHLAEAARLVFAQLGAEGEIRSLDLHDWGDGDTTDLQHILEPLEQAQRLADTGRYAELLSYLEERPQEDLLNSPTMALLSGVAHARLGRLEEGQQWVMISLTRAKAQGDRAVEVRALNVYGAIALEQGGIDEATDFFTRAQSEAMRDGEMATVGRCANNLGIIANMQGDYGRAVGSYTVAITAYQQAGVERGVAETQHNLGITHRDRGCYSEAMQAADRAVQQADRLGDEALKAQALAGRAEIRIVAGQPELAVREAERALTLHCQIGDEVLQTEDQRILANALAGTGRTGEAEKLLCSVIEQARGHQRQLLAATATRDLAWLLWRSSRNDEAVEAAYSARKQFEELGAAVQVQKLDELLELRSVAIGGSK